MDDAERYMVVLGEWEFHSLEVGDRAVIGKDWGDGVSMAMGGEVSLQEKTKKNWHERSPASTATILIEKYFPSKLETLGSDSARPGL